jgi:hypothetical protein
MPTIAHQFVGEWRQVKPDPDPEAIFISFQVDGSLRYQIEGETVQHILLTWRIDGDVLVTDQPSAPRQERTRFRFLSPSQLILEREDESYTYERV